MRRRWLHRALLIATVCGATELGARLIFLVSEGRWLSLRALSEEQASVAQGSLLEMPATGKRSPYAVHPFLGFVYNPEINGPGLTAKHGHPISDFGLIDSGSPIRRRSDDRVVIGIFGGSVAYYLSAEGAATLVARLSEDPPYRGKTVDVVRVALGGWRQPQQLMALSYILALGGELDILLNIDGFNEVTQYTAVPFESRPYFTYPSSWEKLVQDAPQHRVLEGEMAFLRESRRRLADRLSRTPWRHSATFGLLWKRSDTWLAGRLAASTGELERRRAHERRPYVASGPPERHGSDAKLYRALVQLWSRSSLQMDRICRANGIRYLHFLQPNQYDTGSKTLNAEELASAFRERSPYRASVKAGYRGLRAEGQVLRDRGVAFHDLTSLFSGSDETIYADPCCHLTSRGNQILAGAIADALLADDGPGDR